MRVSPSDILSRRQQIAAVALAAVVVGAFVAPQVYGQTSQTDSKVAVVEITGAIDSSSSQYVEDELREARHNDSVEAVVLDIDSPGGSPGSSERMLTAVERTAAEMPVIASVDTLGASGGYYAMLPADEIYVTPSAQVGSVGVIGPAPMPSGPNAGTTAPDKGSFHPDDARATTETIQEVFLENVMEYRGDELEKDREEVAHARMYVGVESVENGFADEVGMTDDAIYEAADRAGLSSVEVVSGLTVDEDEQPEPIPFIEADGETVAVASEEADLSPHQPLAVTPEFWHERFGDLDFEDDDPEVPTNTTDADTGGEKP